MSPEATPESRRCQRPRFARTDARRPGLVGAAGALSLVVMLALGPPHAATTMAAASTPPRSDFGVLVNMYFPPYDECDNPTVTRAALVTLDGTVIPRPLAHYGFPRTFAHPDWWMEDSAFPTGMRFWRLKSDGTHRFSWFARHLSGPVRWSPAGQRLALRRKLPHESSLERKVVIADPTRRTVRVLPLLARRVQDLAWIDERRLLIVYVAGPFDRSTRLAIVHYDKPRQITRLPYRQLTPGRRAFPDYQYLHALAWSPAAHRLVIRSGPYGWIVDLGHRRSVRIPVALRTTSASGNIAEPSWSPDGRRVIVWRGDSVRGWMLDVASMHLHRARALTQHSFYLWVPGGHELVVQDPYSGDLSLIGGEGRVERHIPARWPKDMDSFVLKVPDGAVHTEAVVGRAAYDTC